MTHTIFFITRMKRSLFEDTLIFFHISSQGSNHDLLRSNTAASHDVSRPNTATNDDARGHTTIQSRTAFRAITPTSSKPPTNIGSYYGPSSRVQMPGKPGPVAPPNPYTSMPSTPGRHTTSNHDSQPNSSGSYERLNFQRSGNGYESVGDGYHAYDRKTSIGGELSKLNPVFDESLSTNVRSGAYGSKSSYKN